MCDALLFEKFLALEGEETGGDPRGGVRIIVVQMWWYLWGRFILRLRLGEKEKKRGKKRKIRMRKINRAENQTKGKPESKERRALKQSSLVHKPKNINKT